MHPIRVASASNLRRIFAACPALLGLACSISPAAGPVLAPPGPDSCTRGSRNSSFVSSSTRPLQLRVAAQPHKMGCFSLPRAPRGLRLQLPSSTHATPSRLVVPSIHFSLPSLPSTASRWGSLSTSCKTMEMMPTHSTIRRPRTCGDITPT